MNGKINVTNIYVIVLGIVVFAFGCADILVWAGFSPGIEFGILEISGDDFFRWAWGGLVIVFGGALMLAGAVGMKESLRQFAKVVLGALMVWIIAGTDIFARLCESIPAGEDSPAFFNSLSGFIDGFAPPYPPAIILLPFTLVIAYLVYRHGAENR